MSSVKPRGALRDTDELAGAYARIRGFQNERCMELIELASPQKSETVLDLGCGTGDALVAVKERVGGSGRVIGVDPDKARLKIAIKQSRQFDLDAVLMEGKADDIAGVDDNSVDLVLSNYVLHWVLNKPEMLAEQKRILRPGGRFVFECGGELLQGGIRDFFDLIPDRESFYAENEFLNDAQWRQVIRASGFEIELFEWLEVQLQLTDLRAALEYFEAMTQGAFSAAALRARDVEQLQIKYPGEVVLPVSAVRAFLRKPL
ncbi:class I SAM-dependent methyltransferase [Roseibium sp. RKSG952]|uniref:class I SAM-dependent methyltransferase n=1 Tax=Roseibium sp. RKSG952 TaxID=2529384 RepID=UPI0012BC5B72|nr:methyltransferase domain-containing protein [Roseibium sp. RKSG952]MTH96778.1 methyltransferase domain-containing protein [Roseibium sp. RKSG952]